MTFTTIGVLGALAAFGSLASVAYVVHRRERRHEEAFEAEVSDLRDELRRREAIALDDARIGDGATIEPRRAELSASLRAALRAPAEHGLSAAAR